MFKLMIIFGAVLVLAMVVAYILITVYHKQKTKRTMTNNEYDNYPHD